MNPENQELIPQLIAYQGEMELYLSRLYQDPNTNWEQVWARGRYRPLGILITPLFEMRIDREGPYLPYPDGYRRNDWLNMGDRREKQALAILEAHAKTKRNMCWNCTRLKVYKISRKQEWPICSVGQAVKKRKLCEMSRDMSIQQLEERASKLISIGQKELLP